MTNYRQCLDNIQRTETTHPALWVETYLVDDEPGRKQELVADTAHIPMPDAYRRFFNRWQTALAQNKTIVVKEARVQGRLSIGLGGESVIETAITLHHTYGVPYIPGSALKGLAANYARNKLGEKDWNAKSDAYETLFGDTKSAGYVTFFDALYVPGSGHNDHVLWPDVVTVHHPNYYQGNEPPADWDSPTPVPFLSATGSYLLALGGPADWVEAAFEILALALAEEGVGAKTSSGYGRMAITGMTDARASLQPGAAANPEQAIVDQYLLELEQMPIAGVASQIPAIAQRWQTEEISAANKLLIAQAILNKVQDAGRTKKVQGKAWFEALRNYENANE